MRAPLNPLLLATACLSAVWLAGAGCASAPKEEPPATVKEPACANAASNPLHMVSSGPAARASQDPQIESILNQESSDPRLAWLNRQMYLSLHALDVELRREQRIEACEHPQSSSPTLEAQAGGGAGSTAAMGAPAANGGSAATLGTATIASAAPAASAGSGATPSVATASAASQNSVAGAPAPGAARSTLIRKASLSATGGGGNGATAPKIIAGSDNDIVARRLRKAAEQETNPTLRAKLWKEYADYKQGLAAR